MIKAITPKLKIGVSIFMGLIVFVLCSSYLRHERQKLSDQFEMTKVLKAKKFIPSGKEISSQNVEEVLVPSLFLPPLTLNDLTSLKNQEGRASYSAAQAFLKGEYITRARLINEGNVIGLAWILASEQQAVTLKLDPELALGGFLQPGDLVDVYDTQKKSGPLLSSVRVGGVQKQMWDPSTSIQKKFEDKSGFGEPVLVTVLVPKKSVSALLASSQASKLGLGLNSALQQP